MTSSIVKFYITTESRQPQLPVESGQLIFVRDTGRLFLDFEGLRTEYTNLRVLPTEESRKDILAPAQGFYFVEESNVLYRYKEGWNQVTSGNLEPIFFGDRKSFPPIGKAKTLYVTDEMTYRWDDFIQDYIVVANKTTWATIV